MARAIDSEVAFRFLTEQLVKETGAFSKGVNKGLNIARSAMRNPDAIPALRPVSREQVEKVRGEWQMVSNGSGVCSECHRQDKIDPLAKFCRYCGAPMTDEAVDMVMERMEEVQNDQ